MAYVKKSKLYKLRWDEGEFEGMEVHVRSAPIGELADIMELAEKTDYESSIELMRRFSEKLHWWNLTEEDGSEVPADLKGVRSLDLEEFIEITKQWSKSMAKVSEGLGKESTPGEQPLHMEASIPMEPL